MVLDQLPIKDIVEKIRDSEMGAAFLDETIGSKEKLLQEIEDLEKDSNISQFKKVKKKFLIDLKGRILFGDEWKSSIIDESPEESEDNNQPSTETIGTETRENTEYAGDNYDKEMVKVVRNELKNAGINNRFIQRAILATIAKESAFKPERAEVSYKNTSNARIREIFGARVKGLSDQQLTSLKVNEEAFWDRVYGPDDPTGESQKYGNTQKGDGMKYRGRGFNGITFKNTYKKYGEMIGVDLVKYPEKLGDPVIAAKVNAIYFAQGLQNKIVTNKYGNKKGPNDFKNFQTALQAAIHINAGLGKDFNSHNVQVNYNKALARAKYFEEVDRA